jgi:DNA-binding MarR family transcriptional regulator
VPSPVVKRLMAISVNLCTIILCAIYLPAAWAAVNRLQSNRAQIILNRIGDAMTSTSAKSAPALPDSSEMLCFSIYSAEHAFTQLYRPLLERLNLTYPQFLVMMTLWRRDGQAVKELGKTLFLDSSTLTPLLKRMEAAGLITRTRNPKDEREVQLHLTRQGRALQSQAADVMQCIEQAVGLDGKTVKALKTAIDGIRDSLHKRTKA